MSKKVIYVLTAVSFNKLQNGRTNEEELLKKLTSESAIYYFFFMFGRERKGLNYSYGTLPAFKKEVMYVRVQIPNYIHAIHVQYSAAGREMCIRETKTAHGHNT